MVGPGSLWLVCALVLLVLLLSGWLGLKPDCSAEAKIHNIFKGLRVSWVLIFGLIILSCKLEVIAHFAPAHPMADQWYEVYWFIPYVKHRLLWSGLLTPHGAHRIFFTRLMALALFVGNQQWDNRLQAVVVAILQSGCAVWLFVVLARNRKPAEQLLLAMTMGCFVGLPFARENIVWGFQSQFAFLIIFGCLALRLLTEWPIKSTGFWWGIFCAGACLVSIGSGPLVAIAALGVTLFEWLLASKTWRQQLAPALVFCLISVVGLYFAYRGVNLSQAENFSDFFLCLCKTLAFPLIDQPWLALFLWLPFFVWLWALWQRRLSVTVMTRFIMALGFFVLLHAVAIAKTRGLGGMGPATRYFDILVIGIIVNLVATFDLVQVLGQPNRNWPAWAAVVWLLILSVGGTSRMLDTARYHLIAPDNQAKAISTFLRTDQAEAFADPNAVPFMSVEGLLPFLRNPFIRSILPSSVRLPLVIEPEEPSAFEKKPPIAGKEPSEVYSSCFKFETLRTTELRTKPFPKHTLPYWRFELSGYFAEGTHSLALVSKWKTVEVLPKHAPGEAKIAVFVHRPKKHFYLVAKDQLWSSCFSFSAPTEMGTLSFYNETLLENWWFVICLGLLALLVNTVRTAWFINKSP